MKLIAIMLRMIGFIYAAVIVTIAVIYFMKAKEAIDPLNLKNLITLIVLFIPSFIFFWASRWADDKSNARNQFYNINVEGRKKDNPLN